MILVNVKSYEEMKTVASYSGDKTEAELYMFNNFKTDTLVGFNTFKKRWWYQDKRVAISNKDYVITFDEFKEEYLDTKADNVNSPSHYKQFSREVIDTMQGVSTPEEFKGYLKLNAIKYLSRYQGKNGAEDLKKATWYINKLTEVVENEKASQAN